MLRRSLLEKFDPNLVVYAINDIERCNIDILKRRRKHGDSHAFDFILTSHFRNEANFFSFFFSCVVFGGKEHMIKYQYFFSPLFVT